MTAQWVLETAERFWTAAGGAPDGFPRDLRRAVALALPLAVVDLPRLRVAGVDAWLEERGVALPVAVGDRALRACLLAYAGAGVLFLDGADPDDERRFSLAHEVAHFLVEYQLPRQEAVARLGSGVLAVLDGQRAAAPRERVDAMLAGTPLRTFLHLMERTSDGHAASRHASEAERRADALALELLAPLDAVRACLPAAATASDVEPVLREVFGVPAALARAYARQVAPDVVATDTWRQRLGLG